MGFTIPVVVGGSETIKYKTCFRTEKLHSAKPNCVGSFITFSYSMFFLTRIGKKLSSTLPYATSALETLPQRS